jgi:hypothetical protein
LEKSEPVVHSFFSTFIPQLNTMGTNEEEVIAVEFVNREKNIINFVINKERFGFFHFNPALFKPKIGDMLRVRFEKSKDNKFYKTISVKPAAPTDTSEAIKSFTGKLVMTNKNGFGFVDDVFVYPQLVKRFELKDGDELVGRAIYTYDKKKDSWGWKVFHLVR